MAADGLLLVVMLLASDRVLFSLEVEDSVERNETEELGVIVGVIVSENKDPTLFSSWAAMHVPLQLTTYANVEVERKQPPPASQAVTQPAYAQHASVHAAIVVILETGLLGVQTIGTYGLTGWLLLNSVQNDPALQP